MERRYELRVLAAGAGSLILSHGNNAGFWLVRQHLNMTVIQTFTMWTAMETTLVIIFIMILSAFI